jgi:hypothetical protein
MHRDNNFFVDVVDVRSFHNRSKNWCYRRLHEIREAYGLKEHQRVTRQQFLEYEQLPPDSGKPSNLG